MEDQNDNTKVKKERWKNIKDAVFNVFIEMLKDRKVGHIKVLFFMTFNFMQIYGTILTNTEFIKWKDDIADDFIMDVFHIVRVAPIIIRHNAYLFFWFFYIIGLFNINHRLP